MVESRIREVGSTSTFETYFLFSNFPFLTAILRVRATM
jgi:hypothetical protein